MRERKKQRKKERKKEKKKEKNEPECSCTGDYSMSAGVFFASLSALLPACHPLQQITTGKSDLEETHKNCNTCLVSGQFGSVCAPLEPTVFHVYCKCRSIVLSSLVSSSLV
jgi:hypothetical protein